MITWANPAQITYGTPLSASQLNATASTAGTFDYTPGLGTLLQAGTGQTLAVNFTPDDPLDESTRPRSRSTLHRPPRPWR